MSWLQTLLHGKPVVPACALLLLQRDSVSLDLDSILDRVEPAWGRSFSSGHPYWYSSSMDRGTATFLVGGPMVQVNVKRHPELDEDKETPTLPLLKDRASWNAYKERLEIQCADEKLDPSVRFGIVAKMALAFLDGNCTGIYDSFHRQFLPVSSETASWLQQCVASMGPLPAEPQTGPTLGIILLLRHPITLNEDAIKAGVQRGFGGRFPYSDFWDVTYGRRPHLMADAKSVYFRQEMGAGIEQNALLPPPPSRQGWPTHEAALVFTSRDTDGRELAKRQGAVASTALGFLNENCVGAYDISSRYFSSNLAEIEGLLRQQAALGPQISNPMKSH